MILSWMLHATTLALLLGLAAAALETAVSRCGWPVRGLWIAAGAGSILLSLVALLPARSSASPARVSAAGAALPWAWLDEARPAPATLDAEPWLLAMWVCASAVVAAAVALSHTRLRRRQHGWARREVDGRAVWISSDTGPAVVGLLRGRIVIPDWVLDREPGERALVLAHEQEHLRAGDPRLLFGALLVLAALPWNLPLWWQWRRLRQAVEIDCDRRVLARGLDARVYGRLLVDVARHGTAHRLAVASLSDSPSFLERRIALMLSSRPRTARAALSALFASLLVAAACGMGRPAAPTAERLTLWIASGGTYHLRTPESAAIPEARLGATLRTALARTAEPAVLDVRAYRGAGGYEFIMMRRAACEAGVTRIQFAGDIPAGSRDAFAGIHGAEDIRPTCARLHGPSERRDTALNAARR